MTLKLLAKHHLEFLSLKEGCRGLSKSTLVKIPHCWESHVMADMCAQNMVQSSETPVAPPIESVNQMRL